MLHSPLNSHHKIFFGSQYLNNIIKFSLKFPCESVYHVLKLTNRIIGFVLGWKVHTAYFNLLWGLCDSIYKRMAAYTCDAGMHSSSGCSWWYYVSNHIKNVKPRTDSICRSRECRGASCWIHKNGMLI